MLWRFFGLNEPFPYWVRKKISQSSLWSVMTANGSANGQADGSGSDCTYPLRGARR